MKVAIIGGLAGAYMTRAGYDVLLVDRWQEHVDALNQKGLYIDGVRGKMTVPVKACTPDGLKGPLEAFVASTGKALLRAEIYYRKSMLFPNHTLHAGGSACRCIQRRLSSAIRMDAAQSVITAASTHGAKTSSRIEREPS